MIRTKGLGWNIAFGFIGSILSDIFNEFININDIIYIFLAFETFTMILSYGLPNKVGTLIIDSPSSQFVKKEKGKDDISESVDNASNDKDSDD